MRTGSTGPPPRRSPSSDAAWSPSTSPWSSPFVSRSKRRVRARCPSSRSAASRPRMPGRSWTRCSRGPMDARVRERILAETAATRLPCSSCRGHGRPPSWPTSWRNPVAWSRWPVASRRASSAGSRRSRQTAAACSSPRPRSHSATRRSCGAQPASWGSAPTLPPRPKAAGLIEFRDTIRFRHPLVRAAAYRTASPSRAPRGPPSAGGGDGSRCGSGSPRLAPVADDAHARRGDRGGAGAICRAGPGTRRVRGRLGDARAGRPPDAGSDAARAAGARGRLGEAGCRSARRGARAAGRGRRRSARRPARRRGRASARPDRVRPAARIGCREAAPEAAPASSKPWTPRMSRETYLDALVAAIWASGADAAEVVALVAAGRPGSAAGAPTTARHRHRPGRARDPIVRRLCRRAAAPGSGARGGPDARARHGERRPAARAGRQQGQRHHRDRALGLRRRTGARGAPGHAGPRRRGARRAAVRPQRPRDERDPLREPSRRRRASSRKHGPRPRRSGTRRSATRRCCSRRIAARTRSPRS